MTPSLTATVSPQARHSYLAISSIIRRHFTTPDSRKSSNNYFRSDFTNQPFTGIYEAGAPTEGPLRDASNIGAPRITPVILKQHLDQFVVGQERAKKTLATAVYNHYQRIQELQRREDEEEELLAQEERRRMAHRHPVEGTESDLKRGIAVPSLTRDFDQDEFPGQQSTVNVWPPNVDYKGRGRESGTNGLDPPPLYYPTPLTVEKSNVLLLGPSGVGKTLMAKTLARVLEVPFSMSDCTPFTQAGYIGEDAEVCVQRLLAAANYDVAQAERGIICLDEIDKIATAKVSHGKDVSGEGVQQSLLKIIEGTTLQIQAKQERGSASPNTSSRPTNSPLSGGNINQSGGNPQKGEVYNVKTDNILFICAGAFNGLHKLILDRISKGSIGFGATVRPRPGTHSTTTDPNTSIHETVLEGEDALFHQHLPYYETPQQTPTQPNTPTPTKRTFNTLDLTTPSDLQTYGLIPELVGRIPLTCALHALSIPALVQVLTEPRNSLLKQYIQLFALSSLELRFTTPALHSVARAASRMGTGARALRTVMETLLADAMFEAPGSGVKWVVVTEAVAERKERVVFVGRGEKQGRERVRGMIAAEEEAWVERERLEREARAGEGEESEMQRRARVNSEGGAARTFEEYREKAAGAGFT
ncbi:hypothetical protein MBLNU230_g7664t1 [Neophaeotheca triangularis]